MSKLHNLQGLLTTTSLGGTQASTQLDAILANSTMEEAETLAMATLAETLALAMLAHSTMEVAETLVLHPMRVAMATLGKLLLDLRRGALMTPHLDMPAGTTDIQVTRGINIF